MTFTVYPALDLRGGRVVRLLRGDYDAETAYAADPVETARANAEAGARWLHLVDLDAARGGRWGLAPLVERLVDATGLRVQTGGGIRTPEDVQAALDAGAARAVVGSVAVHEPRTVLRWIERFGPERVTVALDVRREEGGGGWRPATQGWTERADTDLGTLLRLYAGGGLRHLLSTDIDRDGTLAGPSTELYTDIAAIAPGLAVQASGGVASAADLAAARAAGCAGAVVGKALLDGRITAAQALGEQR